MLQTYMEHSHSEGDGKAQMCDYFYLRCSITIRGIIDFHIYIYIIFLKHRHGMWLAKYNSCALLKNKNSMEISSFISSFLSSCVISNFPSDFTKNMLQTREKAKLFLLCWTFFSSVFQHAEHYPQKKTTFDM